MDLATVDETACDLARESLYRFLGAALSDPRGDHWRLVLDPENQCLAHQAARLLSEEASAAPGHLGFDEEPPEALALAPLCAELDQPLAVLQAEHVRVFGLVPARECPPYETEFHPNEESYFRVQQMADVGGFYRAFGLELAQQSPQRPDYLVLELEFIAFLLMKKRLAAQAGDAEDAAICEAAERSFLREHLAWWVPAFAQGLRRRAGGGLYAELGRVLAAFITAERHRLGEETLPAPVQPVCRDQSEEQAACEGCAGAV
jgi:DMSO reductase family type II enzyme chaperone